VRITTGTTALLIALTTVWPGGFSAWRWLVELAPPLSAARAVARIGLLLPLAAAIVLVSVADRRLRRLPRAVVLIGFALAGAEQLARVRLHDKAEQRRWVAEIVRRIDPAARAFVLTRTQRSPGNTRVHVDAMWAASTAGVPTVNGHSGNAPRGWEPMRMVRVRDEAGRREFRASLDAWLAAHRVASEDVQWIEMPLTYRAKAKRSALGSASDRGAPELVQ
jgi:hypothetical protein